MNEQECDDYGLNFDYLDELENEATQFFSTQHLRENDKENTDDAFYSIANLKRNSTEIIDETCSKKMKKPFESIVEIAYDHLLFKNKSNMYYILSTLFKTKITSYSVDLISQMLYQLKENIFDLDETLFPDLTSYFIKNLDNISKFVDLIDPVLLVLTLYLKISNQIDNKFNLSIAHFIQKILENCKNYECLKSISLLLLEFSYKCIDYIYKKPYCLLGQICSCILILDINHKDNLLYLLYIVYAVSNAVTFFEKCDCDCFIKYFDVLFYLVQYTILNYWKMPSQCRIYRNDFCADLIYECIKQIFDFANLVVNDHGKTRLNIRYQYIILAGAPLVYKYRKMSPKEVQEMDEMMAREPGYEIRTNQFQ